MTTEEDLRHLLARDERLTPDADAVHGAIHDGIARRRRRRRTAAGGAAALAVAGLVAVVALPGENGPPPLPQDSLAASAEPLPPPSPTPTTRSPAPTREPGRSPTPTGSARPSRSPGAGTPSAAPPSATAAPRTATPAPTSAPPRTSPPPAATGLATLTGGGLSVSGRALPFGAAYSQVRPVLDAALGAPSQDTGVVGPFSTYGTCPGTQLRVLEYGGLELYFGDVAADSSASGGTPVLYAWQLAPGTARTPARALPGGVALRLGMTVAQLTAGTDDSALELQPVVAGDPPPARFVLTTPAGPVRGSLEPDTSPTAEVIRLAAGRACGD